MTAELPLPKTWFLEGYTDESRRIWRTPVDRFPFRIGRSSRCQLFLDSLSVSQKHAEIQSWRDDGIRLADLGSANGTFVGGERIEKPRPLAEGDVVRFADWEFRLVARLATGAQATTTMEIAALPVHEKKHSDLARKFQAMVESRDLWAVFQPIVRLADRSVLGYEGLGRGVLGGLETPPVDLFAIADSLGRATELSELFREEQLRDAAELPGEPLIFLNTHPAELGSKKTLEQLLESLPAAGLPRLCFEIHEATATDLSILHGVKDQLDAMDASVAFDDFGTGQPRLLELAEIRPRYLKFDRAWIRDLGSATEHRLELVGNLARTVEKLGIQPIVEGVEQREEADACADLGFELAQGFYFGRPERASTF